MSDDDKVREKRSVKLLYVQEPEYKTIVTHIVTDFGKNFFERGKILPLCCWKTFFRGNVN